MVRVAPMYRPRAQAATPVPALACTRGVSRSYRSAMTLREPPVTPVIRPATAADLPRMGRLGSLLVDEHNQFDAKRFLAGRPRTPADYAIFLHAQLEKPEVAVLVAD